jgi:hypothetical protein
MKVKRDHLLDQEAHYSYKTTRLLPPIYSLTAFDCVRERLLVLSEITLQPDDTSYSFVR